jgi:pyruvate formate lyase activating enzyme
LESFRIIGEKFFSQRAELPVLTVSTLLIPGYVDVQEVDSLARLIAGIDPRIPHTLLAFYPSYTLTDLPTTSRQTAYQCLETAKGHLENVRIGNIGLLS